jgi:pantoate--beta-alanine ligase
MKIAKTVESVRDLVKAARSQGKKIGLVPTMGALHIGHVSLIRAAAQQTDFVVVSIFVNPTQFCPGEDFEKYPRPLDADCEICEKAGVDVVFAPTPQEMYPQGSSTREIESCRAVSSRIEAGYLTGLTWVTVEKLTEPLCGQFRPGHFRGVTTVCTKLFNIVGPDVAFFGQKDAQQAIVIKRMVADLNMPLEIVICPTVREPDGLAISSRNQYLTPQQRKDATYVYKSLQKCQEMIDAGTTDTRKILIEMRRVLQQIPSAKIEYVSIVDAETLQSVDEISGRILAAVAVQIGSARLIDNILIDMNR